MVTVEVLRRDLVLNIFKGRASKHFLADSMWAVKKRRVEDESEILVLINTQAPQPFFLSPILPEPSVGSVPALTVWNLLLTL